MARFLLILATVLLAALSLAPSFAHLLEAPPRLGIWTPELWREATVFNSQFMFFLIVGAPVDIAAIVFAALMAYLLRHERTASRFALAGACLLALGLAAWFMLVSPANAILATWKPGPIPADFDNVRLRWETGHMAVAVLKVLGLAAIAAAALMPRLPGQISN
jgi:hypothetical protein